VPGFEEFPKENVWQSILDRKTSIKLLSALKKKLKECDPLLHEESDIILQLIRECEGIGEISAGSPFRQAFFKRKQFEYISELFVSLGIKSPIPLVF